MQDLEVSKLRKIQHINYAMKAYLDKDYFKDVLILNNSIPEVDYNKISLKRNFLNKEINMPIMINAMTGGTDLSFNINRDLSILAKEFNIPIAVGSQSIMFKDRNLEKSFKVVRENNKEGIVIANLSALSSLDKVKEAIHILEADAIQLHINPSQEFVMNEGDRNFKGMLNNIENIIENIDVPTIVKEVGSGISFDACKRLVDIGVNYIDVGGKGGTSFIKIEALRSKSNIYSELQEIEIPTPDSILYCKAANKDLNIISSGGINKGSQIIKSLILGANIAGISGPILKKYLENGLDESREYITDLKRDIKIFMACLGCETLDDLSNIKYYYERQDIIDCFINNKTKLK